jgi:hypothetical protein
MATPRTPVKPKLSPLVVSVFDGTRRLPPANKNILYRVIDGNQKEVFVDDRKQSQISFKLPFFDNFGDDYTVIVSSSGYRQAGFTPIKLSPAVSSRVDLMLIPTEAKFDFSVVSWDWMKTNLPFVASGVTDSAGRSRFQDLLEQKPMTLATLLNITTAMKLINLPQGTPVDYIKQILWDDSFAQDRFFAYCDPALVDQVRTAAAQGEFAPEIGPAFFHPGATASWKQVQFGEANVQLTFHEKETAVINGLKCVVVEPDIDYYKDPAAHSLLEVIPNALTHGLTNPQEVYVLRWIAGRHAGIPEFTPPYTIVPAA